MCEVLYQDSIAVKKFKILYNNFKYLLIYLKKKRRKRGKRMYKLVNSESGFMLPNDHATTYRRMVVLEYMIKVRQV